MVIMLGGGVLSVSLYTVQYDSSPWVPSSVRYAGGVPADIHHVRSVRYAGAVPVHAHDAWLLFLGFFPMRYTGAVAMLIMLGWLRWFLTFLGSIPADAHDAWLWDPISVSTPSIPGS